MTEGADAEDLPIMIDNERRIVTIYGIRYTFELFKAMGTASIGKRFEIVAREDGAVTLRDLNPRGHA